MIDEQESSFGKLMNRNVRVIFRENPEEKGSTCWIGELVKDDGHFIELRSEQGQPSFISKQYIIAISEMRGAW